MANGKGTVNKVILVGRLGSDPQLKYTPSGIAQTTFNVATNRAWKDSDGQQHEQTDWHKIVAWRQLAEVMGEYLKKGSKVYLEGHIQTRNYDDKDGIKRYITEVVVDNMEMLDSKPVNDSPIPDAEPTGRSSETQDDLPF